MRLTLRTLLAYRDGVLDAVHVSELKKKFEESATAKSISQKIEVGIRNRKLIPLPIDAKGFGVDPNDVATFLDGTMPLDRLPEMERRCLESNSLLAEAAASHQILSRALSANSQVSKELLDRLFLIGNTASTSLVAQPNLPSYASPISDGSNMESVRTEGPILTGANGRATVPLTYTHRIDSHHVPPNAPYVQRLEDQSDQATDGILRDSVESLHPGAERERPVDHALSGSLRRNSGVIEDFVDTGIELDDRLGSQIPEYLLGGDKKRLSDILTITILLTLFLFSVWMAMGPIEQIQGLLVAQNRMTSVNELEPITMPASAASFPSPLSKELEPGIEKTSASTVPLEQPFNTVPDFENESPDGSTNRAPVDRDAIADPKEQSISPPRTSDAELSPPAGASAPMGVAGRQPATNWIWPSASTQDDIRFLFVKDKNQREWSMKANSRKMVTPSNDRIAITAPAQCELTTDSTAQGSEFRWLISGDTKVERIETSEQIPRFRLSTRFAKILPSEKSRSLELDFDSGIVVLHFLSSQSEAYIQTRTQLPFIARGVPDALVGLGEARIAAVGGDLELDWKPRNLSQPFPSDPTSTANLNVSTREVAAINVVLRPFHEAVIALPNESGANFFNLQTQPSEFPWWAEELDFGNRSVLTPIQQAFLASPSDWLDTLERFAKSEDLEPALEGLRMQIQLGKYDLLFGSDGIFRRAELKPELGNLLDHLLTQLRDSEDVAEFQTQLKALVGERDVTVMELLIPKTKIELESGADKQLVDYLSDSMIDVRALAIMQLETITGVTHGYQATNPSAESLLAWKRSLAKKQIRWKEPSLPEAPEISQ
ncbi:MAG: hypothetical protein FJ308_02180 [Planctomycetes bacterium]|nr:hypothetical protein [Planctomycetota bacterium]